MLVDSVDGALDGWELSRSLGDALGILLGSEDGALDGRELGIALGDALGMLLV